VQRDGGPVRLGVTWRAMPMETIEGNTVRYESVQTPGGYRLRTIVTTPNDVGARRLPAFLFLQGIYCGSIDRPMTKGNPDAEVIRQFAEAGFITMRVDKSGVGDSQGPACSEINFDEELAGYRAAIAALKSRSDVDPDRVFIFGSSMGGAFAPFVAEGNDVAGIATWGTIASTWFEYELENTRRQMTVLNTPPAEIHERLRAAAQFQSMLVVNKMTIGEIFAAKPELKFEAPMMDDTHQYGRHVSFFHQLQDRNLARAWQDLRGVHVLTLHGEYDWVSSGEDQELIARIVNIANPDFGETLTLDGLDHGMTYHDSLASSVTKFGQGEWLGCVPNAVIEWAERVSKPPARKPLPPAGMR
jgi:uncharacterized protein